MSKQKSIYKSTRGKEEILALYDKQLGRLNCKYSDKWVNTSFGKTHLIKTGKASGIPLLVFHGGNATTKSSNLDASIFRGADICG